MFLCCKSLISGIAFKSHCHSEIALFRDLGGFSAHIWRGGWMLPYFTKKAVSQGDGL